MKILETARELSKAARNTYLFGPEKVNFRMTSNYWLASKLSGSDLSTIVNGANKP